METSVGFAFGIAALGVFVVSYVPQVYLLLCGDGDADASAGVVRTVDPGCLLLSPSAIR